MVQEEGGNDCSTQSILVNPPADRLVGIAVLLTVPLVWGTYNPVVKFLYTLQPPVPGLIFSAAYYIVAAVTLWGILAFLFKQQQPASESNKNTAWRGGIELGSYLFIGNLLQVSALQTIPADRAGFLVQLTTLMVPFMEAFLVRQRALPRRTWVACGLALAGVVALQDPLRWNDPADSMATWSGGDAMILLAAAMYSWHVVRLGYFASQTTPLRLAACKATVEAIASVMSVLVLLLLASANLPGGATPAAREIQSFMNYIAVVGGTLTSSGRETLLSSRDSLSILASILWTGWVTCAYTIYAQSYGQSRVQPTDANLIYTVQPIFTAVFAFALLGETIGPTECVGGALIAASVYVVAADGLDETNL